MSDRAWVYWAQTCTAWCFGSAGYWWALHVWPLSIFAILMGAFSQHWTFLCWRRHLAALANTTGND